MPLFPLFLSALRPVVAAGLLLLLLHAGPRAACAGEPIANVAVFPVENLSGGRVPAEDVRQFLIGRLASSGIAVVRNEILDEFMARHRVRYAAGIDAPTAESLRRELGVDGVLFASFELSVPTVPPRVALIARLVSITSEPTVVWADDAGMAGDDAPGFFELGLVNDYQVLLTKAMGRVSDSLLAYLRTGELPAAPKGASKFRPRSSYRGLELQRDRTYSLAVVPFVNLSERQNAGEILALLFMRHLSSFGQFRVIEAGVARRQLLEARIIMDGGLAISDAETVAALVDADFVLGGRVLRYDDYDGAGRTRVEFSAVLIERESRKVVWSSASYNDGGDGVRFFERGTSRTAHTMATQMVALAAGMIAGNR